MIFHHNFDFIPFSKFGWVGVDLFFVLSGFLITEILLRTLDHKRFLQNFYLRRALRILPVYYLCIVLFFLLTPHFTALADQQAYYFPHQVFLWTNTQNWLYILFRIPDNFIILGHLWSLSVEEQFYLIWPLLVLLFRTRRRLGIILLIFMAFGILSRILSWKLLNEYTSFEFQERTRMDGLYVGCLIAIWNFYSPALLKKKLFFLVTSLLLIHIIAAVCIKIFCPSVPHFRFLGFTSIAAIFGLLLYYGISSNGKFKDFFSGNRLLKWFGKISYGLYVYHWPILTLFKIYFTNGMEQIGMSHFSSHIFLSIISMIVAICISWLSYNFFEKKILALKGRFS